MELTQAMFLDAVLDYAETAVVDTSTHDHREKSARGKLPWATVARRKWRNRNA